MSPSDPESKAREYVLGYSRTEAERLTRQAELFAPLTERFFREAGIGPGDRVLDLGSGLGDVSMLAARLVGPSGQVLGVERDAGSIEHARRRAAQAGLENLTFTQSDVTRLDEGDRFDAAVGRFILMFLPNPGDVLRSVSRLVRPGGVVAFQEPSWHPLLALGAPYPLWAKTLHAIHTTVTRSGADTEMGPHLAPLFVEAGLPRPTMRMEALLSGDAGVIRALSDILYSLAPLAKEHGVAFDGLEPLDTLADRVAAELLEMRGVAASIPLVGAWARTSPSDGDD